jgi:hypothetical protein
VEVFRSEELLYGVIVHHVFSCDPGSGRSVPEEPLPTVPPSCSMCIGRGGSCDLVAMEMCLQSYCLATVDSFGSIILALGRHVTILIGCGGFSLLSPVTTASIC